MKKIAIILVALIASVVVAQTTKPKPVDILIGRIMESYEKAVDDANASYAKSIAPLLRRYGSLRDRKILAAGNSAIKRLDAARKGASELDGIRMEQEIEKIRNSLDGKVGNAPNVSPQAPALEVCGISFKGHKYLAITSKANWKEAFALCKKMGGHLAYFETADEMNAIASAFNINSKYWVGAEETSAGWKWGNKKPVGKLWGKGHPFNRRECYAAMCPNPARLGTIRSDENRAGFICEWE